MKATRLLLTLSFLVASMTATSVMAQDASPKLKIDEITCRAMLKQGGEERDFTLIFMNGFISGKKSELIFDGAALLEATEKVFDGCIEKPDASLLSIFDKVRK